MTRANQATQTFPSSERIELKSSCGPLFELVCRFEWAQYDIRTWSQAEPCSLMSSSEAKGVAIAFQVVAELRTCERIS